MEIKPAQLAAALERKPLAPLWLVHGNAPLLVLEAADAIRAAARAAGFVERETLVADQHFKWSQLALAGGNLSLFGGAKLIDLRIPSGRPGRDGGDALQAHAAAPPVDTLTLITLPEIDWTARRTSWFKALSAAAHCVECNAPERAALPAWIAQRLRAQQLDASPEALDFIAEHVEGNLLAAHQEVLKLALLHPGARLELAEVEAAVLDVSRHRLEDLRDAVLAGDPARCARLLASLQEEAAPAPLLLWSLANEVRTLERLRQARASGEALNAAFRRERVFDASRQRLLNTALQRLNGSQLRRALLSLARLDRIFKGVQEGSFDDELLQLCLDLSRS